MTAASTPTRAEQECFCCQDASGHTSTQDWGAWPAHGLASAVYAPINQAAQKRAARRIGSSSGMNYAHANREVEVLARP